MLEEVPVPADRVLSCAALSSRASLIAATSGMRDFGRSTSKRPRLRAPAAAASFWKGRASRVAAISPSTPAIRQSAAISTTSEPRVRPKASPSTSEDCRRVSRPSAVPADATRASWRRRGGSRHRWRRPSRRCARRSPAVGADQVVEEGLVDGSPSAMRPSRRSAITRTSWRRWARSWSLSRSRIANARTIAGEQQQDQQGEEDEAGGEAPTHRWLLRAGSRHPEPRSRARRRRPPRASAAADRW